LELQEEILGLFHIHRLVYGNDMLAKDKKIKVASKKILLPFFTNWITQTQKEAARYSQSYLNRNRLKTKTIIYPLLGE